MESNSKISLLKINYWTLFFNTDSIITLCHFLELDSSPKILEGTLRNIYSLKYLVQYISYIF